MSAFFAAAPANALHALQVCGDRSKMVDRLATEYQESRTGIGLDARGKVIELYTSKTGSWTILVTIAGGRTCVVGVGENWVTTPLLAPTSHTVGA